MLYRVPRRWKLVTVLGYTRYGLNNILALCRRFGNNASNGGRLFTRVLLVFVSRNKMRTLWLRTNFRLRHAGFGQVKCLLAEMKKRFSNLVPLGQIGMIKR